MKSKFRFTSLSFYIKVPSTINQLGKFEAVLMSYGAVKSNSYSENYICFRARIIQHFCNNPFLWTNKSVLSLHQEKKQLEYKIYYHFPVTFFSISIISSLLWQFPLGVLGATSYLIRYLLTIYFLQKDIVDRFESAGEENRYLRLAREYVNRFQIVI